jgi:ferritin-like metal-binding protein YciE
MATKARQGRRRPRKETPDATELLVLELQAIHNAESQLSSVLPRLSKAIDSEKLGPMVDERLEEGERIINEIEAVFDEMEESPGRRKNVAAEGLINDAREHVQEIESGPSLDAVLIATIQKTEHYCIAAWGTAKALAEAVGQKAAVRAMDRALKEGGKFDRRLTELAEKEITPALLALGSEESAKGLEEGGRGRQNNGGAERAAAT